MRTTLLLVLALPLLVFVSTGSYATSVAASLPEFNGTLHNPGEPYPLPAVTVGTFSYIIPAGEVLASAWLSGTYGNSTIPNTCPLENRLDGVLVGTVLFGSPPTQNQSPTPWTYNLAPAELGVLADGSATLTCTQANYYVIRLGVTTLHIETVVPEPSGAIALLFGIMGAGALRRRRR